LLVKSKTYQRLSNFFLYAGVLGGIASHLLGFLPSTIRDPLKWVSILLVVLAILLPLLRAFTQVKERLKWEAEFYARRGSKKKSVLKPTQFPAALYVISMLVVALGLAFIFLVPDGYQSYVIQSDAVSWPHTAGEVISAEVVTQSQSGIDESDLYQPKIVTRYVVNGRTYHTREIRFNQSSFWRTDTTYAYEVIEKLAPGTKVDVYYDPDDPAVAVLDKSADWFTYFMLALGAILVLCGVYWFWLSLRDTYSFLRELRKRPAK